MSMNNIALTSGMRQNLFSLQQTNNMMDKTASRLSTGKKVQTALDDPINFFAAQGHNQRASDLAQRKDQMGEAIQTIKAANNGIEAITTLIASAKSLANSANALDLSSTTERGELADQYDEILSQIDDLAGDSGYKGVNLLDSGALTVEYNEDGTSSSDISGFDGDSAGLLLTASEGTWADADEVKVDTDKMDAARDSLRTKTQTLTTELSTITTREDFTTKMINTLQDGATSLTNADMNEESANMLMLQTRQALGTSSLSMASQAAQSVLRLF